MKNVSIVNTISNSQRKSSRINFRGKFLLTNLFILIFCIQTGYSQMAEDANLQLNGTNAVLTVTLADTASVTELEVQLGNKDGLSDLFSQTFNYDQTTGLPQGMSYSRLGSGVTLGLGEITISSTLFARIRLKNSGNWSDWYSFVSN